MRPAAESENTHPAAPPLLIPTHALQRVVAPARGTSTGRSAWFGVLEAVHRITATLHLPCTALCDGRCERMDHEETVLLLPYEMEYVTEKGGLRGSPFDVIAIDGLDCGLMGFTREYPCLGQKGCAIYEFRPLDCRSFPIIPYFRPDGSIEFYLAPYCPLKDTLPLEFVSGLTSCWRQLSPVLSWSWKSYYNSLSKYTYRLQEAGPAVEA